MRRIRRRGNDSPVYEAVTQGVLVRVLPEYLAEESSEEDGRYVWAYTVEIENRGEATVQLVSRRWTITDALNHVSEIKGAGVVGEQPTLKPGEAFRYTSGCPLSTPSGAMRGAYQMLTTKGEVFEAQIPEFSLHLPGAAKRVN